MTIKLTDAAKYFKGTKEQTEALDYLQKNTLPYVLEEFEKLWRKEPEPKTLISKKLSYPAVFLIKEYEGFSSKAYYDPHTGGLPITIGYGSTRKKDGSCFIIGNTITEKEAEDLLLYQIETEFLPSLQKIPYWNEMNDEMKSALISFAYNLGANFYGASGFNTITKVLREKKWEEVPKTLELYRNPGSSVEKGLLRRRIAEGKLFREGLNKLNE